MTNHHMLHALITSMTLDPEWTGVTHKFTDTGTIELSRDNKIIGKIWTKEDMLVIEVLDDNRAEQQGLINRIKEIKLISPFIPMVLLRYFGVELPICDPER